jgi:cell division protein FtsI/penicillin-binding protein 2
LSPPLQQAQRRRRLLTRALPVALIGVASFVFGVTVGASSPAREAAERFAEAWARQDFPAMHGELTGAAASRYPLEAFTRIYSDAQATATVDTVVPGDPEGPQDVPEGEAVTVPMTVRTHAFGAVGADLVLPVDDDEIAWAPHLAFPGLQPGERLDRRVRVPKRAPILARDGTPLAEGPPATRSSPLGEASINVVGELGIPKGEQAEELERLGFPEGVLTGISGLELAFNLRLGGQPGGELLALGDERQDGGEPRVLASREPKPGKAVHTTIDPALQEAAVAALGELFGGVAVLDADDGSVRALAGIAFSGPQPPGSTMKVITTVAALDAGAVRLDETFPVETSNTEIGREISNAHDEPCGGTFVQAFARSCNTVFAPLGTEVGGERLVETAELFGFNSPPALYDAQATAAVKPPMSTIPERLESDVEVGVSAIGQGEVLATPLLLATASQVIANEGTRSPTPIVTDPGLSPIPEDVTVTSPETAATVRDLMIEVVNSGTGIAAALPGVQVAGKTGTAELGPAALEEGEEPPAEGEEPEQELDAWFTAFAPAKAPEIAVAVMVVNAEGDGGEVAAPIAREVLATELVG